MFKNLNMCNMEIIKVSETRISHNIQILCCHTISSLSKYLNFLEKGFKFDKSKDFFNNHKNMHTKESF